MEKEVNIEKLNNAILYFAQNTNFCVKTKMIKLLYYLDLYHFEATGVPVTNITYLAWDKGPLNHNLSKLLSEPDETLSKFIASVPLNDSDDKLKGHLIKARPNAKFDSDEFTNRELKTLELIAEIFKDTKLNDMIDATHQRNDPWDIVFNKQNQKYKKIDLKLVYINSRDKDEKIKAIDEYNHIKQLFQ